MSQFRAIGNAIADEIEARGHAQDTRTANENQGGDGPCCVLTADAAEPLHNTITLKAEFAKALGLDVPTKTVAGYTIMEWNDCTPTEEVLATLRSL